MIYGFSAKLKDRRIDRILVKHGHVNFEVFYSPITTYLLFYLLLFFTALPYSFYLFNCGFFLLAFIPVNYLITAYLNNSFAIAGEELIVINPNFPFRTFVKYELDSIDSIKIDCTKWLLYSNYIEIRTKNIKRKYYCVCLKLDTYDENWTENTVDDFLAALKKKDINVDFKLD